MKKLIPFLITLLMVNLCGPIEKKPGEPLPEEHPTWTKAIEGYNSEEEIREAYSLIEEPEKLDFLLRLFRENKGVKDSIHMDVSFPEIDSTELQTF